jgi:hypothetical protein
MERRAIIIAIAVVAVLAIVFSALFYWGLQSYFPSPVAHDTDRWAVIKDANGDSLAVEPSSNATWDQLVQLSQNSTTKWIGGTVEAYGNSWGFRFAPDNITIADFTAEGLQTTVKDLSNNLDYWLGKQAYVSATVAEVHSPS